MTMTVPETDTEGPTMWRPRSQADLAPRGEKAKANANLAALAALRDVQRSGQPATPEQAALLARWAGWGALPNIFDEADPTWNAERLQLRLLLLDEAEWAASRRTTLNAHYTSADIVAAMWQTALELGFSGGKVLEPGCGSGNFIGLAPIPAQFVGVELDPTTAAIAAALYPGADIRCQGFEESRFAPGHFDLVMGNVPFAKVALHDVEHNKARHSVHNHFIIKSLRFLRPGGLALMLTSRYTMDSRNSAARREMSDLAELVGAVRLPEGAFYAAAGTQAMEDLLILRRRTDDPSLFSASWGALAPLAVEGGETEINEYFVRYPDRMLGKAGIGRGMYRDDEFSLKCAEPLAPLLSAALSEIVADALAAELGWVEPPRPTKPKLSVASAKQDPSPTAPPAPVGAPRAATLPEAGGVAIPPPPLKEGTILAHDGPTGFGQVRYGVIEDYEPKVKADRAELAELVRLRDIIAVLLDVQSSTLNDHRFAGYQLALNAAYDAYVGQYGPINRFTLRNTGRYVNACSSCCNEWPARGVNDVHPICPLCHAAHGLDPTPKTARVRPRMGGFRLADPDFPSLLALEIFDPDSQTAEKAPIFRSRVVAPRERADAAANARDALSLCLDEYGDVRVEVIAQLLDVEPEEARGLLGGLVWEDPASGELQTSARYLSGNIREKLIVAKARATEDERFAAHVEALAEVLPEDLGPTEIDARLGATWIEEDDIVAFLKQVIGAEHPGVVHIVQTATWVVGVDRWARRSVAMTSTWGTSRCDAAELVQFSLNQRPATVYDPLPDKKRILNAAETLAAREKQEVIEERFREWVWEDADRATRLARVYNDRFNSTVEPRFDGSHLTLPGATVGDHFKPHPHQLNSIWRIICEQSVGLFQPVGSGKTFIMAAAGMELRRLGLVRKPVYVVPNHMLEQFCAEFLQHYPLARVLLATKEQTEAAHRKEFVARCAMGDWDAVIITRSAFEKIPVSPLVKARFLDAKMGELRQAIAANDERISVKRMELALSKLEERHERLMAEHHKDNGVNFEEAGFDYVFADEAHAYKNMAFPTHMQGVGGEGSQRAEDMEVKVAFLRERYGDKVCTLATATPVANSLAEIFVMQRMLQPQALYDAQVVEFDQWAANFGQTVNAIELSPDGSSYRVGSRFARFRNVPDLMRMFRMVADVRTPEELKLPTPALAGGQAEVVVAAPTDALREFMAEVAERAEKIRNRRVDPTEDNMLKISTDGRKGALDLRLVNRNPDGDDKVVMAADRIAAIYADHRNVRYRDLGGAISGRPGAFQLVFCDLGTPHEERWSVYTHLREMLVARGVPAGAVRFIHEARDDRQKAEMFQACRDGRIAVLVASTEKAGVGTNIQARMLALHHLDCPWRPCDIEQREGRIMRQGNQNTAVRIIRYVTEASFDIYLWQTVARKAAFIYQVMSGKFKGREVDDLGEQALTYAEVKALATGNPLLLEQAGVDNALAKTVRARRAHFQDQVRLGRIMETAEENIDALERVAAQCEAAIAKRVPTRADAFAMTVRGVHYTDRTLACTALLTHLNAGMHRATREGHAEVVGSLGGLDVTATWRESGYYGGYRQVSLGVSFAATPLSLWLGREEMRQQKSPGYVLKLENMLGDLEWKRTRAVTEADRNRSELAQARDRIGMAFPGEADLAGLQRRAAEIAAELARMTDQQSKQKKESA